MAITTIEELKNKKYIEVELPGWNETDLFVCKIQRVQLLDLVAKGKIPNPLIATVTKIFKGQGPTGEDKEEMKLMNELMELFAELIMVEPKFEDVQEAIGLTDIQKRILYNFALRGVLAIEPFRRESGVNFSSKYGGALQEKA